MPVLATISAPTVLWYLSRSTGLVLLGLLTATLVLGVAIRAGWAPRNWPRFVVADLHRNLSLLAVLLLALHVITAELDPFAPVGWLAVVVPFVSNYRPIWLGLGALSVDMTVAVIATSLLRSRLRLSTWRAVHWLAYLSWPVALLHSLGTGTDTRLSWAFDYELVCLALVVATMLVRLWQLPAARRWSRAAGTMLVAASPLVVLTWAALGPLQPGWAKSAGTPTSLLASGSSTSGQGTTAPPATPSTSLSYFQAPFSGTLTDRSSGALETVVISGDVLGGMRGTLDVSLQGTAAGGGDISVTSGQCSYRPATIPGVFAGRLSTIQGGTLVMIIGSGSPVALDLEIQSQGGSGAVSGLVTVGPVPRGDTGGGGEG
jgi:sulfoxide reductase heme-binding subunit YedZ